MKKWFIIAVVLMMSLAVTAGCGQQEMAGTDAGTAVEAAATAVEEVTIQQSLAKAGADASVDDLMGSWTDINSADRFANITKTDSGYQYEDNEGKYPATFAEGVLKVKASESVTVDVYIDGTTGHLLLVDQENITEFIKKQ